jgi:sigma-B regulation protein RsbU (phosphoserine phosphatase)
MATLEITFLQNQLEERKRRLETAIALAPLRGGLTGLLREVDAALERMDKGSYGICEECHESIEADRLISDPLVRYCLDHLTGPQRAALQRDLDLASQVQRRLLPQAGLCNGGWETGYHYAPVGPVSGDYCDLIPSDGQLFFVLGDVSGKGVAASMLMTQLHALFRSLTGMGLPLNQIVTQANRMFCECALAGQYVTLVCGQARPDGEVEIHNAGHLPAIIVGQGGVHRVESTGLPLGMFMNVDGDGEFLATRLRLEAGDTMFFYTDGLSEARGSNDSSDDEADDEYGLDRVARLVGEQAARPPAALIAAFVDDLRGFAGADAFHDDLTLLAIQRRG